MTTPSHRFTLTVQSSHDPLYLLKLYRDRLCVSSDLPFSLDVAPDTKWLPAEKPAPKQVASIFELLDKPSPSVQALCVQLLVIHDRGYTLLGDRGGEVEPPPSFTDDDFTLLSDLVGELQGYGVPAIYTRPAPVLNAGHEHALKCLADVEVLLGSTGLLELFRKNPGKADAARNLDLAMKAFLKEVQ